MFLSVLITILYRFYAFPVSATSPAHPIHIYSTCMVMRIDTEAPHYIIFFIFFLLLPFISKYVPSSPPHSQTPPHSTFFPNVRPSLLLLLLLLLLCFGPFFRDKTCSATSHFQRQRHIS